MGNIIDILALRTKKTKYSDAEVVLGLQSKDKRMEDWFYASCKKYFMDKFGEIFFDMDRKQEVFQTAFVKLWTQIDNGTIRIESGQLHRQKANGLYAPMTCTLQTFLMAIAKNEYREIVRNNREEYYAEFFEDEDQVAVLVPDWDNEADEDEQKNRIVSQCVADLSPRCVEILTLCYYQGKSIEEVLEIRRDKNSNLNALRVAKSKCMTMLKERILSQFTKYRLSI